MTAKEPLYMNPHLAIGDIGYGYHKACLVNTSLPAACVCTPVALMEPSIQTPHQQPAIATERIRTPS